MAAIHRTNSISDFTSSPSENHASLSTRVSALTHAIHPGVPESNTLLPRSQDVLAMKVDTKISLLHALLQRTKELLKSTAEKDQSYALIEIAAIYMALPDFLSACALVREAISITYYQTGPAKDKLDDLIYLIQYQLSIGDGQGTANSIQNLFLFIKKNELTPFDKLTAILSYAQLQRQFGDSKAAEEAFEPIEIMLQAVLKDSSVRSSENISPLCCLVSLYAQAQNMPDTRRVLDLAYSLATTLNEEERANAVIKIAHTHALACQTLSTPTLQEELACSQLLYHKYSRVYFLLQLATSQLQDEVEDPSNTTQNLLDSFENILSDPHQLNFATVALCHEVASFLAERDLKEQALALLERAMRLARETSLTSYLRDPSILSLAHVYGKLGAIDHLQDLAKKFEHESDVFHHILLHIVIAQAKLQDFTALKITIDRMRVPLYKVEAYLNLAYATGLAHNNEDTKSALSTASTVVAQMGGYHKLSADVLDYFLNILEELQDTQYLESMLSDIQEESLKTKVLISLAKIQTVQFRLKDAEATLDRIQSAYEHIYASNLIAKKLLKNSSSLHKV